MKPKKTPAALKQERLEHANALLRIIASYGRRFFWFGGTNVYDKATGTSTFVPADRYARLELRRGHVYFVNEYSERAVYLENTGFRNNWKGFGHGGTLRGLVEDVRDYVSKGTLVPRWRIGVKQLGQKGFEGNVWGYPATDAEKVRDLAFALPMFEPAVVLVQETFDKLEELVAENYHGDAYKTAAEALGLTELAATFDRIRKEQLKADELLPHLYQERHAAYQQLMLEAKKLLSAMQYDKLYGSFKAARLRPRFTA